MGLRMRFVLSILCSALLPILTGAGEIYGVIVEGKSPVGEGVTIEVESDDVPIKTQTEADGSYRLNVARTGRCRLSVYVPGAQPSTFVDIYSFEDPTRVDLVLEKTPDGRYLLRRR